MEGGNEGGNDVRVLAPSTYLTSMSLPATTSRTAPEVVGDVGAGGYWGVMAVAAPTCMVKVNDLSPKHAAAAAAAVAAAAAAAAASIGRSIARSVTPVEDACPLLGTTGKQWEALGSSGSFWGACGSPRDRRSCLGAPWARVRAARDGLVVAEVGQHLVKEEGDSRRMQQVLSVNEARSDSNQGEEEDQHGRADSEASSPPEEPCRAGHTAP